LNPSELINTDDYQWSSKQTYINSEGKIRNLANQSLGYLSQFLFIFINFYISSTLSLIVVWLVDHREAPNGFTRLIQWFCAFQVIMDLGFFLSGFSMSAGYYNAVTYGVANNSTFSPGSRSHLYDFSQFILSIGDQGSVMFTTVMAFTFFQIARIQGAIDITKFLFIGVSISVGSGMLIAVLQLSLCRAPSWKYECGVITARGWISVVCIVINIYYGIRVSMLLKAMKPGRRKDAISSLASRIRFYAGWVAFSRIGYIGLTISTGTFNLDFLDAEHTRLMNVFSSLTYLMWLPTGTGFAIYYLYTHPDEFRFFTDLCRRREGVTFLPQDLCELYDRMVISCCGFFRTSRYPAIEGDDHDNDGIGGGDPEEEGSSMATGNGSTAAGGLGRAPGTSNVGTSFGSNGGGGNKTVNPIQADGLGSTTNNGRSGSEHSPSSRISSPQGLEVRSFVSAGSSGTTLHGSKSAQSSNSIRGSDAAATRATSRGSVRRASVSYGRRLDRQHEDLMLDACLLDDGESRSSTVNEGSTEQSFVTSTSTTTTTSMGTNATGIGAIELGAGVRDSRGEGAMPIQRSVRHSEV